MAGNDGIRIERLAYMLDGKPILAGVDAVFPPGTITLLIGPNGCGKTMLLEMIAGLRKPDGGQVYVDGIPLWQGRKPDRCLLRRLGFVTQQPEQMLFARTVREEFAYSLNPFRWPKERQTAAMERAVVHWLAGDNGEPSATASAFPQRERSSAETRHRAQPDAPAPSCPQPGRLSAEMQRRRHPIPAASDFPHPSEPSPKIGARPGQSQTSGWLAADPLALSGGQRRRLAMAVTEAAEPDWLLLDEPTAGLDRPVLGRLRRRLTERRTAGLGAVVVTHDAEDWLDVADGVLLMRDGRIVWSGSPAELANHPELWREAGLELPEPFRTAELLVRNGFRLPAGLPDPEALADALASQLALAEPVSSRIEDIRDSRFPSSAIPPMANRVPLPDVPSGNEPPAPEGRAPVVPVGNEREAAAGEPVKVSPDETTAGPAEPPFSSAERENPLNRYDPRSLWLACLAVTAGIGLQTSWTGWLLGAAASALAVRFSGVPARVFLRPAKALLPFALITSLFAGWDLSAAGAFDVPTAVDTFRRFSKLAMMAMPGFALMAGISPFRLKRALERGLRPLGAARVPVGRFALASALLLRFLPLLFESWDRFARIAASRGKRPVKPGSVPLSLVVMTTIPFLLSLIRLGESLAATLALRGAGRQAAMIGRREKGMRHHGSIGPPDGTPSSFTRRDAFLVAGAAALLAVFIATRKTV